jgi:hypothetical protein
MGFKEPIPDTSSNVKRLLGNQYLCHSFFESAGFIHVPAERHLYSGHLPVKRSSVKFDIGFVIKISGMTSGSSDGLSPRPV